jgi:threonine synthase
LLKETGLHTKTLPPSSSIRAAVAGLEQAIHKRVVSKDDTVVCLVTGHGFKDPESLQRAAIDYSPVAIEEPELEKTLLAYL